MKLIDCHCHLGYGKDSQDPDAVLRRARTAGVVGFVNVGTTAETSAQAIESASQYADVWATVGLHPHDATNGLDAIVPLISRPNVVAVGECGLDYHYDHSPRVVQRDVFAAQIALAKQHGLALVIHTRDAWDDTFDILDAEGLPDRTIFHCFTAGPVEARKCLDRGAYLSFSGVVTFKNAADNREAAALCPTTRLLVETDSPYLTPVPYRGRPNEPALVRIVAEAIAGVRGVPTVAVADWTFRNTVVAFGLPADLG